MTKTIDWVANRLIELDGRCSGLDSFLEDAVQVVENFLSDRPNRPLLYKNLLNYLLNKEDLPEKVRYLVEMTD